MFWKIYFWSYVVLSVVGAYGFLDNYLTVADVLGIFMALLIGMGVYSYAYNRHFLSSQVWLMVFIFVVASLGLEAIYRVTALDILSNFLISKYIIGVSNLAVTMVLITPALIALWILGTKRIPKTKKK